MPYRNRKSTYGNFILIFVGIKILFNLLAINHFGFHRDELLHLALGNHLAWGYKEVPPFIALLANIILHVFGNSLIATRIFPTLFAAVMVWFAGKLVVEMGGRKMAITIACLTLIFSPAFAASDYLFQPVIFDQFWWLLAAYLVVRYINTKNNLNLYLLGVVVGVGLLNKYTMAFFVVSLIIGLLLSRQHRVILSRQFVISALIAVMIFLPNAIWQATHHMPIVTHMGKLAKYQLDGNSRTDFIIQQFLCNGTGLFVWITGLLALFLSYRLRKYLFLGIAYLLVFAFLLKMHGKIYYLFPAYPMLFAAGGYMIESWIRKKWLGLRVVAIVIVIVPNLVLFPLVLPFLSLQQTLSYTAATAKRLHSVRFLMTWEDRKQHPLTQDYADMLSWEEMVSKTAKVYHSLSPEEQQQTVILADNYGEAGAFVHFGPKYGLPQIVSLDSSFALWAPASITPQNLIYVSDDNDVSDLTPLAASTTRADGVTNPLAREFGTGIFLIKGLKPQLQQIYKKVLNERLSE
ncbi:ArnT family glycosyltransferase [Mucilaginibacter ginkgonis]|uniref:Glycosyltransferase family 39 protein n=1 Tax=Mucilaginibacter ginkgonis TaxID=2682091 RepID=A0A6I4I2V8_9SPHI|nr:glycosyltransferase family 39 protein [Mucilaginibacter ginkgonis]QQL50655.1 glycosyltransferase family 39 protein [Mucilaginibacter ginkgonis]